MDELVIPIAKPRADFVFGLGLLARLHLADQQAKLLSEGVEALPPRAAAVLVHVADEDFIEEVVNIEQHGLVVRSGHHEGGAGDGGGRGHLGLWGSGLADGHCEGREGQVGRCRYRYFEKAMLVLLLNVDGLRDALAICSKATAVGSRGVCVRGNVQLRCVQQSLYVVIAFPKVGSVLSKRCVSWFLFGWYGGVGCTGWSHALERSKEREIFARRESSDGEDEYRAVKTTITTNRRWC
jgi:hypothetical protein